VTILLFPSDRLGILTSVNHKLLLDMRVLAFATPPLLQLALILQMLLPLNLAHPVAQDQGEVDAKRQTNGRHDDGDQGRSLATIITPLQAPGGVPTLATRVHLVDMIIFHGNEDNGPAEE